MKSIRRGWLGWHALTQEGRGADKSKQPGGQSQVYGFSQGNRFASIRSYVIAVTYSLRECQHVATFAKNVDGATTAIHGLGDHGNGGL